MPRFAQPRYVEFMASLPKTGTEKVRKAELRSVGVGPGTIDLALSARP
jgi:crotonobetaine/carnitine-CoA ligase